jgi:hypothetical protein
MTLSGISRESVATVFDLMFLLFRGFWLLGWSVAVLILGALTVFFFFYAESVRLQDGRLVHAPRLGPLKIFVEYDLVRVHNARLEKAGAEGSVRIRFDYEGRSCTVGDGMSRLDGEQLLEEIRRAGASVEAAGASEPSQAERPPAQSRPPVPPPEEAPPSVTSPSGIALIAANLAPLGGVLFLGWDLTSIVVLFWAESAVIGFYTVAKMAIVGRLAAIVAAPFFVGHFGGFMSGHFLLIYALFVRGASATGPPPGVREAMLQIFDPLWTPLAGLFISHGISFFDNFLGRREYERARMKDLMTAPYSRIVIMQLALIFGGWIVLLLGDPVPALALLVLLKTAIDFSAHRKEHGER